ncbi:MAG: hypothetical protein U0893_25220 [Chloroflexota bacterium]
MDRDEQFDKNLELARLHLTSLLAEPTDRWPPDGSTIIYCPADDPELATANLKALACNAITDSDAPPSPAVMIGPDFRQHPSNRTPEAEAGPDEMKPPA